MSQGGKEAVRADDEVVAASEVRRLEERVRELERLLGRKTMESSCSRKRSIWRGQKNRCCCRARRCPEIPREDDRRDAGRGALQPD